MFPIVRRKFWFFACMEQIVSVAYKFSVNRRLESTFRPLKDTKRFRVAKFRVIDIFFLFDPFFIFNFSKYYFIQILTLQVKI